MMIHLVVAGNVEAGVSPAGKPERQSKKETAIHMTESQLQGRWTDGDAGGRLTNEWIFSKPNLTLKKYNGQIINATYTLQGNTLTMHHKANMVHKAWDETAEIKRYDGDALSWYCLGVYLKLHRQP